MHSLKVLRPLSVSRRKRKETVEKFRQNMQSSSFSHGDGGVDGREGFLSPGSPAGL